MRPFDALKFVGANFVIAPKHCGARDSWQHESEALRNSDYAPTGEPVGGQSVSFGNQRRRETQDGIPGPKCTGWLDDVDVVSRKQLLGCPHWKYAIASKHKDRRYYEIVEDTIHPEFEYLYFVFYDRQGVARAIQPFFILDLDILGGLRSRFGKLIHAVRRFWPRFMYLRTMMVGCVAGEGHIDGDDEQTRAAIGGLLARSVARHARSRRVRLIVLKEFPRRYRAALRSFVESGFTRIPSMPQTQLNVPFHSFEDYMRRALKSDTRRKLLKKFQTAELGAPTEMSVVVDIERVIDEIYDLYRQVYERSVLKFEHLTKEYFRRLSVEMTDKSTFFLWRRDGKLVAFCNCMGQRDTLFVEYLGLDYDVALKLHLYHYVFRDIVRWAIANKYELIQNGSLNYDPKLHFRHRLDPLDLYVKHTSSVLNAALRLALPWLEPTRYDRTLPKFPNYFELWD